MSHARKLTHVHTMDPVRVALQTIGTGARNAANTWTLQEWASRLAARAGPRDYVGQLRNLYGDIIERWRYVQENGERVPESANAVLGHVLGASYNQGPTCPSPEHCDLARTQWSANTRGWGDCDDVSTLAAAGVIALGMRPLLRVVPWETGGHVSVVTRTPKGEWVSLDPVGHPDNAFGWAMPQQGFRNPILYFDLNAKRVKGPTAQQLQRKHTKMAVLAKQAGPFLQGTDGRRTYASDLRRATVPTAKRSLPVGRTFMLSPRGVPRAAIENAHVVMVRPGDTRGRRVLTLPRYHAQIFSRGLASDRAPAVDQYGEAYEYLAGIDAWCPMGEWEYDVANGGRYSDYLSGFGRRRRRRRRRTRAERRARRRRFFKKAGKAFRRVFKFTARMAARILDSRIAKSTVGTLLGVFGIPREVTNSIFSAAAAMLREDGKITDFVKLLLRGKFKKAARIAKQVAQAGGKALRKGIVPKVPGFSGADVPTHAVPREMWGQMDADEDDRDADLHWHMEAANGREYAVAPVMALRMGEPTEASDVSQAVIAPAPTPGAFYRVKKGDTLLGVAGKAFGLSSGSARTGKAKMINASQYNRVFARPSKSGYEKNVFGDTILSFSPRFALEPSAQEDGQKGSSYPVIWIPQAGEEPPMKEEADAPPITPTPTPEAPPVQVPPEQVEPPAADDGIPPMPTDPCPAGFKYKLTPAFKSGDRMVPAGWSCVPDPDYVAPTKPKPPAIEPKPPEPTPDEPERTVEKEPPTEPDPDYWDQIPSSPGDISIERPKCPPGTRPHWESGQPGFGPMSCKPVDAPVIPSQPQPGSQPPPGTEVPGGKKEGDGAAGALLATVLAVMAALS